MSSNSYWGLSSDNLHKMYKRKVEALQVARENRNTMREYDILNEMRRIEEAIKNTEPGSKRRR